VNHEGLERLSGVSFSPLQSRKLNESDVPSHTAALRIPTMVKMGSFALIGVANSLIDFGVFAFGYKLLEMPLVLSKVVAWLVAVSGSYV
jgi:hypothetical protein